MNYRYVVGAAAVAVLTIAGCGKRDAAKGGMEVGEQVAVFHPLNVTGPAAGTKTCQV